MKLSGIKLALSVCLGLLLLAALAVLLALKPLRLPAADNTTPAESLITHYYSEEELDALTMIRKGETSIVPKCENLNELKYSFKFECVRDPRVYNTEYDPYLILMSDTGKKLFLFYDPETLDVIDGIYVYGFPLRNDVEALIREVVESEYSYHDMDVLWDYSSGLGTSGRLDSYFVQVKEGMIMLDAYNRETAEIVSQYFFSNDQLFGDAPLEAPGLGLASPVLPVDKTGSADLSAFANICPALFCPHI